MDSLAEISFAEGDMRQSISLWLEAAAIADKYAQNEQDSLTYSGFLQSLGVCYRRISQMDSTMYYYNLAWDIIHDKTSPVAISEKTRLLTSMAILLTFMGRDEESMEYADRAMKMSAQDTDMEMIIYAATNAGGIYARNGRFDKGADALRYAVGKAGESGLPDKQLSVLTIMTSMFNLAGERDSVDHYMALAEKFVDMLPPESVSVLGFRETQAQVLRSMGRYAESNDIYRRLMAISGENSSVREDTGYLTMARNYFDMKQWNDAAEYYEKAYSAVDSIYGEEVTAQLSEWSAKYETAEKELEISRLTEESLKNRTMLQRWIIIAVSLCAVLIIVIMGVIFRYKQRKKEEGLRLARNYIDGLEKERARVARDLHDGVCNDLLGIGMHISSMNSQDITDRKHEEILSMLENLRSEIRTISHDMMPPSFRFSDIKEVMETYAERFRSQTQIEISFTAERKGTRSWQEVPDKVSYEVYRIFQEETANIIKHSGTDRIDVLFTINDRLLSLSITYNGRTVKENEYFKSTGKGLSVMQERAVYIGARIKRSDSEDNHIFTLEVPLE